VQREIRRAVAGLERWRGVIRAKHPVSQSGCHGNHGGRERPEHRIMPF
jgi:hypothetical protein